MADAPAPEKSKIPVSMSNSTTLGELYKFVSDMNILRAAGKDPDDALKELIDNCSTNAEKDALRAKYAQLKAMGLVGRDGWVCENEEFKKQVNLLMNELSSSKVGKEAEYKSAQKEYNDMRHKYEAGRRERNFGLFRKWGSVALAIGLVVGACFALPALAGLVAGAIGGAASIGAAIGAGVLAGGALYGVYRVSKWFVTENFTKGNDMIVHGKNEMDKYKDDYTDAKNKFNEAAAELKNVKNNFKGLQQLNGFFDASEEDKARAKEKFKDEKVFSVEASEEGLDLDRRNALQAAAEDKFNKLREKYERMVDGATTRKDLERAAEWFDNATDGIMFESDRDKLDKALDNHGDAKTDLEISDEYYDVEKQVAIDILKNAGTKLVELRSDKKFSRSALESILKTTPEEKIASVKTKKDIEKMIEEAVDKLDLYGAAAKETAVAKLNTELKLDDATRPAIGQKLPNAATRAALRDDKEVKSFYTVEDVVKLTERVARNAKNSDGTAIYSNADIAMIEHQVREKALVVTYSLKNGKMGDKKTIDLVKDGSLLSTTLLDFVKLDTINVSPKLPTDIESKAASPAHMMEARLKAYASIGEMADGMSPTLTGAIQEATRKAAAETDPVKREKIYKEATAEIDKGLKKEKKSFVREKLDTDFANECKKPENIGLRQLFDKDGNVRTDISAELQYSANMFKAAVRSKGDLSRLDVKFDNATRDNGPLSDVYADKKLLVSSTYSANLRGMKAENLAIALRDAAEDLRDAKTPEEKQAAYARYIEKQELTEQLQLLGVADVRGLTEEEMRSVISYEDELERERLEAEAREREEEERKKREEEDKKRAEEEAEAE